MPFSLAPHRFLPTFLVVVAPATALFVAPLAAQNRALPPARASVLPSSLPIGTSDVQAAFLVDGALTLAQQTPAARANVVRGAAALLPRLTATAGARGRDALTARWMSLAMGVPRSVRSDSLSSLFDVASKVDLPWAARWAPQIPDDAARSGALLDVSRGYEALHAPKSWNRADYYAASAQNAAREEANPLARARALVFVAYRMTELSPARQEEALREARAQVRRISNPAQRDNLLAELTGAAARFDLNGGRRLAAEISDPGLKNLAAARVDLIEVSQTTLTTRSRERVTALTTAAAPYDSRALPVLLQLPAQPEVLKAIGDTLPRIYPTAHPAIETTQLERIWNYTQTAPAGAYRDQLQSRLARLMVTQDLWRGRAWGKQLGWRGGRVQVGAFLNQVLRARRFDLGAARLQDTARTDPNAAYEAALALPPAARAQALLLLAGQLLG